jgi:hypothetical protein
MYYCRSGLHIDAATWSRLLADPTYRVLEQEFALDGTFISTVWVGLNHNNDDAPHIFETMVFSDSSCDTELSCRRYSTVRQALLGHAETVRKHNMFSESQKCLVPSTPSSS